MRLRNYDAFASCDWGWNAPGVVLWWLCLASGGYHIIHEYKFQKETAESVAASVRRQTHDLGIERLRYLVADPAMWQKTGAGRGESIAETFQRLRLPMRRGDNDRFNGWMRVHQLLRTMPDGSRPYLTIEPTCRYLIRTLPSMTQDDNNPEDVDTDSDDHAVDALRYGAMSRPTLLRTNRVEAPPPGTLGAMLAEMLRPTRERLGSELRA